MSASLQDIIANMTIHEVELHKHAPPMPIDDETNSTLICLPVVPRSMRYLRWIVPIPVEGFRAGVGEYLKDMPEIYPTKEEKAELMLPRPSIAYLPSNFKNDHQVSTFVELILHAVAAIVGKLDPSKAMYTLDPERNSPLHCGWSNMNWGPMHGSQYRASGVKLVTLALPMWCFANKDMADFTAAQEFINPSSLEKEDPQKVSSSTRLWARLHDFCYLHDAHYFIVSTYTQWAFGAFSDHWTAAYVTSPMKFNATDPNVIQSALFWMHSSTGHPRGYKALKVHDEPEHDEFSNYRKGKRKARDDECEWKDLAGKRGYKNRRCFLKLPDAWKDPKEFFGPQWEPRRRSGREKMRFTAYANSSPGPEPALEVAYAGRAELAQDFQGRRASEIRPPPGPFTVPFTGPSLGPAQLSTQLSALSTDGPPAQAPATTIPFPPNDESRVEVPPTGFAALFTDPTGIPGPGIHAPVPMPSGADADVCASLFSGINLAGSAPAMLSSLPPGSSQPVATNHLGDASTGLSPTSTINASSGAAGLSASQGGFAAEPSGPQF